MSMPFGFVKDKPLTKEDFEPLRIVSLWEMIKFYAHDVLQICRVLDHFSRNIIALGNPDAVINDLPDDLYSSFRDNLRRFHQNLIIMDLKCSAMSMERLLQALVTNPSFTSPDQLIGLIRETIARITDELTNELIMLIPKRSARFYKLAGTFLGERLLTTLHHVTMLREDAEEAGNCFAAGRYTACVFHLMRIMEKLVQELATKVRATKGGVPIDVKNEEWFHIEKSIHNAVNVDKMPKGDKKESYGKVLAALSGVRIGWRNPTMHPKDTYTEQEANDLIVSVRAFTEAFVALPELKEE